MGDKMTQSKIAHDDILSAMMAWEGDELDHAATIKLFQALIDSGEVWSLQGCYGRQANAFIQAGLCKFKPVKVPVTKSRGNNHA